MGLTKAFLDPISSTKAGKRNLITDVPGIKVGHQTLKNERLNTGVTAIIPCNDNIFRQKMPAAMHVINGFGKSTSSIQIEELGTLETPIVLTNTLAVGTAYQAVVKRMLAENPEIGWTTGTVNPIILECNDGQINHIRDLGVEEEDVTAAFNQAAESFAEGAVGAGTGMCCYDLKGGIGSASRQIEIDGQIFTLGALVLANFGFLEDLNIYNQPVGQKLQQLQQREEHKEKGSIVTVIATDIPFDSRQLKRIAKRSSVGITRTGAFIGNESGEITLAFSTANRQAHATEESRQLSTKTAISEEFMDRYFRMTVSCVEEAVLSCLVHAETMTDIHGKKRLCLAEALRKLQEKTKKEEIGLLLRQLGL